MANMEEASPNYANSSSSARAPDGKLARLNMESGMNTFLEKFCSKENDISLEEDNSFQGAQASEQWNSLDGISFDDSSEWGRSNSSSMSWFDESEQEATLKVKDMMDNIEKMLYGEVHAPLHKPVLEECLQWRLRFPHLRVVGTAVDFSPPEMGVNNHNFPETGSGTVDETRNSSDQNGGECPEEDKEEVYAAHGIIEHTPAISHEFQDDNKPVESQRRKVIKEALLNELTLHVWKEAVLPALQPFIEKHNRPTEARDHEFTTEGIAEELNKLNLTEIHRKQKGSVPVLPSQPRTPLSARLSCSSKTESYFNHDDPFECYRRHSDQPFLSGKRPVRTLVRSEISEEEGDCDVTGAQDAYGNVSEPRRRGRRCYNGRTVVEENDELGRAADRYTALGRRLQPSSPKEQRSEGIKEMKPPGRSRVSANSYSRLVGRSDKLKQPERHLSHSKPRDLKLPAIEDSKWSPNNELSNTFSRRSSSALPKLAPKNFRPTTVYRNMQGEISSASREDPMPKSEICPYGERFTFHNKRYEQVQSTTSSIERNKRERPRNSRYHQQQS